MKCLIDCDVLLYEVGFAGQYKDEETGELCAKSFDDVSELFDQKIKEIEAECWATEPSLLFLTNNKLIYKRNEKAKAKVRKQAAKNNETICQADEPAKYIPNFRDKVAKKKQYKGNRKSVKPIHWENLLVYAQATYDTVLAEGMEADDLMCIEQMKAEPLSTIICTRDKDLRICPGMHFGWTCGRQLQFGPKQVEPLGDLTLKGSKLTGTGLMFFYSQIITGDATDNIPGLPRGGPAMAHRILWECNTEEDMFNAVVTEYERVYEEDSEDGYACDEPLWHREMNEQAQLLWMIMELDEQGEPVKYLMYDERG